MSIPVDSLLLHPLQPAPSDTVPADNLLTWWSQSGLLQWRDENANIFQEGFKTNIRNGNYTVQKSDRNTILRSTGAGSITITIAADAGDVKTDLPDGSVLIILRSDVGAVDIDLSAVTLIGPSNLPAPYTLRLGESVLLQKINGSFWKVFLDPNKAFEVHQYAPTAGSRTVSIAAGGVSSMALATTVWSGEIAVGLNTETSGGVMAAAAGVLTALRDRAGQIVNGVSLTFSNARTIGSKTFAAGEEFINDNGKLGGLLRTTATDGTNNSGANLFIDFVLIKGFSITPVTIDGDYTLGLPVALAVEDVPFTLP